MAKIKIKNLKILKKKLNQDWKNLSYTNKL